MVEHVEVLKQMMTAAGGMLAAIFAVWKWYTARQDSKEEKIREEIAKERERVAKLNADVMNILNEQIRELREENENLRDNSCTIKGCRLRMLGA